MLVRATIEPMTSYPLPNGTVLSERYRIDAFLAEGGMALVYRAHDLRLERDVAIKVVKHEFIDSPGYETSFLDEAKLAAKVSHPNLVNVFDQGVEGGSDYLVMELVEGKTLRQILAKFVTIEPNRAIDVIASVLAGLSALHKVGVIHRDVKPENIILANDGRIKLTDFGLARPTAQIQAEGSPLYGTIAYTAPEVLRGERLDPRCDIYSIGVTLYELLTGRQPFEGDSKAVAKAHLYERVAAPSALNPAVSAAIDTFVLKATNRDAALRFDTAAEMLSELKSLALVSKQENQTRVIAQGTERISDQTELISPADLEDLDQEPKPKRRLATWLAITVSAILLGLGVGWWFGTGPGALITVPNLVSMSAADAQSTVGLLPIKLITIDENSDQPVGSVTRTDPVAGSYLIRGGTLKAYLSIGPKLNSVPSLLGKNLVEATATLRGANFWIGKTSEAFNDAPLGTIYDYTGADGSVLPDGSNIDLKISLGPIPVVSGVSLDVAKGLLTAAGLTVGKVTQVYNDTVASGQVVSLVPQSIELTKGSSVDLTVSKGTNKVIMPKVVGETIAASKLALEQLGLKVVVDTDVLTSRWGIAKVKSASASKGSTLRIGDTVTIVSR